MKKRIGSINLSGIERKRDDDGRLICLNCDKYLPKRRRKYCSDDCSYEFATKHNHGLMRGKLIKRCKGICSECKRQMVKKILREDSYSHISVKDFKELYTSFESSIKVTSGYAIKIDDAKLILDHKVPIALGGEEFDEDNLQILCLDCNRVKTRKDHADIAKQRKIEKTMGSGQITLPSAIPNGRI